MTSEEQALASIDKERVKTLRVLLSDKYDSDIKELTALKDILTDTKLQDLRNTKNTPDATEEVLDIYKCLAWISDSNVAPGWSLIRNVLCQAPSLPTEAHISQWLMIAKYIMGNVCRQVMPQLHTHHKLMLVEMKANELQWKKDIAEVEDKMAKEVESRKEMDEVSKKEREELLKRLESIEKKEAETKKIVEETMRIKDATITELKATIDAEVRRRSSPSASSSPDPLSTPPRFHPFPPVSDTTPLPTFSIPPSPGIVVGALFPALTFT